MTYEMWRDSGDTQNESPVVSNILRSLKETEYSLNRIREEQEEYLTFAENARFLDLNIKKQLSDQYELKVLRMEQDVEDMKNNLEHMGVNM